MERWSCERELTLPPWNGERLMKRPGEWYGQRVNESAGPAARSTLVPERREVTLSEERRWPGSRRAGSVRGKKV